MPYNVFKMFVVRLLLFSVLLYNTEAIFHDEYDGATGNRTATSETIPVLVEYTPTNWSRTTNWWLHRSDADENNKTQYYESVSVKDLPTVSDKEPANVTYPSNETYAFAVSEPYENDVRNLTVDNGILTAHLPTKKLDWPYNWFAETYKKTRSTRRPYNSYWKDKLVNVTTSTIATPYYRYNQTDVDSEITTTSKPFSWHWFYKHQNDIYTSTTPYYRYNKTVIDAEPTTTKRPYYSYSYDEWRTEGEEDRNTTTIPRNLWYYNSSTAPYGYNVSTTIDTKYNITITDGNYNLEATVYPIVNRINSSDRNVTKKATTDQVNVKTPISRRNPVNISINSSMNTNEATNYGAFTGFLKKIAGYIVPNASNIAPNSNITNLAVASGNGNMFFYIYN